MSHDDGFVRSGDTHYPNGVPVATAWYALIGHVQFDERGVETEHDLILRHWQSKEPATAMQT
jgi:hypothetical protein